MKSQTFANLNPMRFLMEYKSKKKRKDALFAWILILPAIVILSIVIIYPLIQALILSFHQANLLNIKQAPFIGLANFDRLIHDDVFWISLKNTLIFVSLSVVFGLVIGMILALILNEKIPFRNFFRGIALIPWVVPQVVIALLFLYMFNSQVGIVNWLLLKLGLTSNLVDWFGSTKNALWAEIIANTWNQIPFYMLMILAGLQTVPQNQYEAADIDGANGFHKFLYVTLPNIRGVIMIVSCLMVIWNFNNFDLIWTTTQGGPVNATMTLAVYVYRNAFVGLDIGYAAAIGLIWLLILLFFSTFYIRVMKGDDFND